MTLVRRPYIWLVIGVFIATFALILWMRFSASDVPDVTSVSPDEQYEVTLTELNRFLDRNFHIHLRNRVTSDRELIFESPDEGPAGSERFIWSHDSKYILLVGRNFYVEPELKLRTGESIYLIHHIPTRRIWSNASQKPDLPRIDAYMVEEMVTLENVVQ